MPWWDETSACLVHNDLRCCRGGARFRRMNQFFSDPGSSERRTDTVFQNLECVRRDDEFRFGERLFLGELAAIPGVPSTTQPVLPILTSMPPFIPSKEGRGTQRGLLRRPIAVV